MNITVKDYMVMHQIATTFEGDEKKLNKAVLSHFNLLNLSVEESELKLAEINLKLTEEPQFYPVFKHNNVEYGFIPNLDKISTGEYIDIDILQNNKESIHKLMAVLYRPVTKKYKGKYDIEDYDPDNLNDEVMLGIDVKYFLGAMVFFYHLSNELLKATLTSTLQEVKTM